MSLLKEALDLTNISLDSFIIQKSKSDQSYRLAQLEKHPQFATVSAKGKSIVKLFATQTYKSAKAQGALSMLDEKQINQLRKVTVLHLLQVKQEIQLSKLLSELQLDKILFLYRILTQMSTKNLISIKINEKTGVVHILGSKRRRQPIKTKDEFSAQCQQRLNSILASNNKIIQSLVKNQIDVV